MTFAARIVAVSWVNSSRIVTLVLVTASAIAWVMILAPYAAAVRATAVTSLASSIKRASQLSAAPLKSSLRMLGNARWTLLAFTQCAFPSAPCFVLASLRITSPASSPALVTSALAALVSDKIGTSWAYGWIKCGAMVFTKWARSTADSHATSTWPCAR